MYIFGKNSLFCSLQSLEITSSTFFRACIRLGMYHLPGFWHAMMRFAKI